MTAAGVLRAEWTKFATIRSTTILSVAIVALSTMFGWLFGTASAHQYAAGSAQDRLDFDPMTPAARGLFIVQLLVAGLGALVASSEYGSGTIRASAAAVGRRRLLTAKAGMTVLAALPVSVAAVWLMVLTCMATLSARGAPAVWFGDATVIRILTLGPLVPTLLALFGLALGFLMRATAAAVNVSTGTNAEAALARIESESGRLARLVDDLLLLAFLDEPERLDLTPMDLRTLAADARHDFAALDPSRPIAFTGPGDGPAASAPVLGDEARLRQVVSNLVGNAVTHTPAGSPVRIGVGTVGEQAVLVIEDEGPGLSAEESARVFDRFYRADGSRARSTGGAGLGLAIVRSIVAAHGGRVEVRSAPGRGAAFQVLLPAIDT
ncbi:cell wall metabolism sensor histidine kinase WalK [Nonomuraea sp. NEAU-A123]|uniref:sensor histidine kinase n=1 Tax=Nonomuraea sp. NEAU-A123 TaxID=2839649 RepID=UPI001BE45D08|nr:ATP-binding protein [Nonomuraea sp. NEAU-A123]MBT2231112.1 ATP-binding protein [Nonomuraea sp. NEAU-A123]